MNHKEDSMAADLKQITEMALSLQPEERILLVEQLLQSLESGGLYDIDETWVDEMEKRYLEVKEEDVLRIVEGDAGKLIDDKKE